MKQEQIQHCFATLVFNNASSAFACEIVTTGACAPKQHILPTLVQSVLMIHRLITHHAYVS